MLIDTTAHHAAIVPWQMLAQRPGIRLAFIPVDRNGRIDNSAHTGCFV
ncbi:MAG: aminotransferase class V-fold PLP-dependent enzyme [Coriobacteriales bacterium]|nr:aminotransferase class V-fold PLP-dependent enzyme [Coriobacteriales bacterium]